MSRFSRRLVGVTMAACIAQAVLIAAQVSAATIPVDIRVSTDQAQELAQVRQYVGNPELRSYSGPDCFNGAKQSTAEGYQTSYPSFTDALQEASESVAGMQPFRLSNADYASFGSLTICTVGAPTPPGFFLLKRNHEGLSVGGDLQGIARNDVLLAHRSGPDFTVGEELDIFAPARAAPGQPVPVSVIQYNGAGDQVAAAGATVFGGVTPVVTDASGNATVILPPGEPRVYATDDPDDVASPMLPVCVAVQLETCNAKRGLVIFGSAERDLISGTLGDDQIQARAGDDAIRGRGGSDRINVRGGGKDKVNCGGGKDKVKGDRKDRIGANCETVKGRRSGGRPKKGKAKK